MHEKCGGYCPGGTGGAGLGGIVAGVGAVFQAEGAGADKAASGVPLGTEPVVRAAAGEPPRSGIDCGDDVVEKTGALVGATGFAKVEEPPAGVIDE
jgi:hypothetical protein